MWHQPKRSSHTGKQQRQLVMTIEKGDRCTSPVHLHVDDATPVHVHVKKPKKPAKSALGRAVDDRLSESKAKHVGGTSSNLRRSTATAHSRSKSPGPPSGGPWVPPPGKTSKALKYSWQGPGSRLEIANPQDAENIQSTLRLSDLSTDEEDHVKGQMRQYEKKIDGLMTEVGSLKDRVSLEKTVRQMEKKDELLDTSRRALEEQEFEIDRYRHELEATEKENQILRQSLGRLQPSPDISHELLMKKLVEVEMDGQAAAKQVAALRDSIRRIKEDKNHSSSDGAMLMKQKELLMERLADFESSNRTLRSILRDRHENEADTVHLTEQRDLLLRKLSETEGMAHRYKSDLLDKDRLITDLKLQSDAQREENCAISGLQTSLESTRAHLQKQLRQKDADCNRMAVQIRALETQLAQEKIETDHLASLLEGAKQKTQHDKEALKKATRVQKQRAARSEDAIETLNAQLLERDNYIAELRGEIDNMNSQCDKMTKEKSQIMAERAALNTRTTELENIVTRVEDGAKHEVREITAKLHEKTSDVAACKLENERLKTSLSTIEDKLAQGEGEINQLRQSLKQYETLVDEYRTQMNRSRREADETMIHLEEQKRESARIQRDGEVEIDKVKNRLQTRLQELEPIPELLRSTELRLQDANEKLLAYEKRNTENTKLIAELTSKVEHQSDQLDGFRERWHTSQDENRLFQTKHEAYDRKLRELEDQNRDLLQTCAKREEGLHQATMRLDEKTREAASFSRQLETALADARRTAEQAREKAASKERANQSRILDLEAQLSQARAELASLKREKEEAERKFNSRLYDIKDRLEQSHSTNRSMQNYVQFLKTSYANVFGDTSAIAGTSPLRGTTFPY